MGVCLSVSLLSIVVVSLSFVYVYVYCLLCVCGSVLSVGSLVSCAVDVVLLFVPLVCGFFFVVCRRRCVSLCVVVCIFQMYVYVRMECLCVYVYVHVHVNDVVLEEACGRCVET